MKALPIVVRIIGAQALIGLVASALWAVVAGGQAGLAAVTGAVIAVVSNAFFASRVFLRSAPDPGGMLRGLISAELMKLALLVALFLVAMRWFAGDFLPLISTYGATALVFLWALRWSDPTSDLQGSR